MIKRFTLFGALALAAVGLSACSDDAKTASYNLSKAADMFEVQRRIVFYNGITDAYIFTIEGKCSIEPISGRLEVICKEGPNAFKKHFLGLSDNVTYLAEQVESRGVSVYHTRVIFKPQSVIPDIDFRGDLQELLSTGE